MQRLVHKMKFMNSLNVGRNDSLNCDWLSDSWCDFDLSFWVWSKWSNTNRRPFCVFNKQIYVSQRLASHFAGIDWLHWCMSQHKIDAQTRRHSVSQPKHCNGRRLDKIGSDLHTSCQAADRRDNSSICDETEHYHSIERESILFNWTRWFDGVCLFDTCTDDGCKAYTSYHRGRYEKVICALQFGRFCCSWQIGRRQIYSRPAQQRTVSRNHTQQSKETIFQKTIQLHWWRSHIETMRWRHNGQQQHTVIEQNVRTSVEERKRCLADLDNSTTICSIE